MSDTKNPRIPNSFVNQFSECTGTLTSFGGGVRKTLDRFLGGDRQQTLDMYREIGVRVDPRDTYVFSVVVLDPSVVASGRIGDVSSDIRKQVQKLWVAVYDAETTEDAWFASTQISPELRVVLNNAFAGSQSFSAEDGPQPSSWHMPYDFAAALKALDVLISGELNSDEMRSGGVRVTSAGHEVIVGVAGAGGSADAKIARYLGQQVGLTISMQHDGGIAAIQPTPPTS